MLPDLAPHSPDDARITIHVRDLGPGAAERNAIQFRVKPTTKFKKVAAAYVQQQQQGGDLDDRGGCAGASPPVRLLVHGRRVLANSTVTVAEGRSFLL
ncbi:hypothetical protein GGF31_001169 [Allomyces arbusculus]|nr:hypothetical protein GGF31_001169 [Allomyces arbusculus]